MALPLQQDGELRGTPPPGTPPRTQLMERLPSSSSSSDGGGVGGGGAGSDVDPDRIPAAVFERDPSSESNKDWSMMSTESVFGLQVAPSSDYTGFFLANPDLMDIATPPRSSAAAAAGLSVDTAAAAAAAGDAPPAVISPPFESIPDLPDNGKFSFAFPNLIEDKRHCSKKHSQRQPEQAAAAATEAAKAVPAPAEEAEAKAAEEQQEETGSKPEAAPDPEEGKGGLFSCFPCC